MPFSQLRVHPVLPTAVASSLVARLPTVMEGLSLVLLTRAQGHPYWVVGGVSAALILGLGVGSPALGRLSDRLGAPPVMMASCLAAVLALLVLAAIPDRLGVTGLLVGAAIVGAAEPPVTSVVRALLVRLPAEGEGEGLLTLEAALQELLFVFGPPLAALLAGISPRLAVAACAALLLLGTAWFTVVVRHHTPPTPREPGPSVVSGTPMRLLLAAFAFTGLAFGAIDLSTIASLDHQGHRGWAGVALAVWAFGSLIAGVVAAKHPFADLWGALPRVLLAMAVLSMPLLWLRQPVLLGVGLLLQGASIAPALGAVFSLVPLVTAPSQLTEAFSWAAAAILGGVSAGSAITGVVLDRVGVAAGFGLAVAGPLAAAWTATLLARHRLSPPVTA